jgi:hypothetical protein
MCQSNPEGSGITLAREKAKLNFSLFLEPLAPAAAAEAERDMRCSLRSPSRQRMFASSPAEVEAEGAVVAAAVAGLLRDRNLRAGLWNIGHSPDPRKTPHCSRACGPDDRR